MSGAAVRCFLTARDGGARLTEQAPLRRCASEGGALPRLVIDTQHRFQTHLGFGGAFTEAAAMTWQRLDAAQQQQVLSDCFSAERGHGYTLCRLHMGSCDFALGNYAHAETPGDLALQGFNIERDRQALLPFIQAALRVAGTKPMPLEKAARYSS